MKLGFGAAGSAFIVSLLVGFLSGAGFLSVFLRAVFFAAAFFGFVFGAYKVISLFLPELLGLPDEESVGVETGLGSRVDVVVGDDDERSEEAGDVLAGRRQPRKTADEEEPEEAEEIEAFMPESGLTPETAAVADAMGLDQGSEGRYTESRDTNGVPQSLGSRGVEPALPRGLIDDVDVLPDLDSMSDSFVSPLVDEATERSSGESIASRPSSVSRSSETGGDFDSREMAAAIRTILKRDQKG